MDNCIFCKIVSKQIPSQPLFENDSLIVINDIHPKAPVHLLIIPKKHIESVNTLTADDEKIVGEVIFTAKEMAEKQGLSQRGYKLVFNVGKEGGQTVPHLHLHLLGGKQMAE